MSDQDQFAELHCRSAFSFLRGASQPEDLVKVAAAKGLRAMALCDRDGVYGAPRFSAACREAGICPIIGCELTMEDGSILPVLVENRTGYRNLCQLLTRAHLRSEKGKASLAWRELRDSVQGLVALTGNGEGPLVRALQSEGSSLARDVLPLLKDLFGRENVFVEVHRHLLRGEYRLFNALHQAAEQHGLPLLPSNSPLYATESGRLVHDVFTCILNHTTVDAAGLLLQPNAERRIKGPQEMAELFPSQPEAIANTARLAERLTFTLEDLGYEFPKYPVGPGETMEGVLREQTRVGARQRYPGGVPEKVQKQIEHELALVGKLGFAGYFLIVADIVKFCRENNILAQGRGSAANSTVCFCLGITAVDPLKFNTLFERFLSEGRKGWPDIDIDLPSGERRERVIQEVYQRYGKHGAAMTANVITYRGKSCAREIGKVLGLGVDFMDRFSHLFASGDFQHTLGLSEHLQQAGLAATHPRAQAFTDVYERMYGLPRHLGQHSGGMIISQGQLSSVVPLENASMPGRVVVQWDKDDCEDLGIIKVDLLGLGMMSVLQDTITLTRERGRPVDLAQIPKDDPKTYAMMCEADTIGVFQIESRAQMATLPRMKPRTFYDVCIEVAIIRPGPIQGDLVHPYLARRSGKEPVTYDDARLVPVLERTLGVPLFQEQLLQIAMVMADFTGSEAEELRRALSFHRSQERMDKVCAKLRERMQQKGVAPEAIDRVVKSTTSFALYGFPESHAISFALLAYASAYLKAHRAPEFYASLLNNQPMGFYSPATLVRDAKKHGVQVRPVCAMRSQVRCLLEADNSIRLGFCVVRGLNRASADRIVGERLIQSFASLDDFKRRTALHKDELRTLAELGALNCFAAHRRDALWRAEEAVRENDLFSGLAEQGKDSPLAPMDAADRLRADFTGMHMTTGPHPMALLRARLPDVWRAADLPLGDNGIVVRIAGNVICRQRPGTAKGFVFLSLEDETGVSNAIITPPMFEQHRLVITEEPFLMVQGRLQKTDGVIHVRAEKVERLNCANTPAVASHDFH